MRIFHFIFLFANFFNLVAQNSIKLKHANAFTYFDFELNSFVALDDSSYLWVFDQRQKAWLKKPMHLEIQTSFDHFLTDYLPFSEKGSPTYYINVGCGIVYKRSNFQILRHDKSFEHRNQFGGSYFMFKGEPYIFGGYGLFTTKNIITHYDTTLREWFEVNVKSAVSPPNLLGALAFVDKNNVSFFTGFQQSSEEAKLKPDYSIWQFNFRTSRWKKIGVVDTKYRNSITRDNVKTVTTSASQFPIITFSNRLVKFDLPFGQLMEYEFPSMRYYFHSILEGDLILISKKTISDSISVEVHHQDYLKKSKSRSVYFISKSDKGEKEIFSNPLYVIFGLLFFSLCFVLLIKKIISFNYSKTNTKSIKHQEKQDYLSQFNENHRLVLDLFIFNKNEGLEISVLNDLVNFDQPSIDTLKKRRELLLKELRQQIATVFGVNAKEAIIGKPLLADKRMKLLFLNDAVYDKIISNGKNLGE